jgi:elongation factor Ts
MMECKRALTETGGDFDKAVEVLRSWGMAGAQKRSGRTASEGLVEAYLHQTSPDLPPKVGVLVELNCETDFVAKSPEFKELAKRIAQQIAAMRPRWVTKDEVTEEELETERRVILASDAVKDKKPEIVEKIVEGRLRSLLSDQGGALMEQVWWRDSAGKKTIGELVTEFAARVKENVGVNRFAYFRVGEER